VVGPAGHSSLLERQSLAGFRVDLSNEGEEAVAGGELEFKLAGNAVEPGEFRRGVSFVPDLGDDASRWGLRREESLHVQSRSRPADRVNPVAKATHSRVGAPAWSIPSWIAASI
jgi:hypothetical protein